MSSVEHRAGKLEFWALAMKLLKKDDVVIIHYCIVKAALGAFTVFEPLWVRFATTLPNVACQHALRTTNACCQVPIQQALHRACCHGKQAVLSLTITSAC